MALRRIGVKTVSFGSEGGQGSEFFLGDPVVEIDQREDTAESGLAVVSTTVKVDDANIDQMVSTVETAILKVDFAYSLDAGALQASTAHRVSVQITDNDDHVVILPYCLHSAIAPPSVTFTAQDIFDDDGKRYWAIRDGDKIYGEKKINFPIAL